MKAVLIALMLANTGFATDAQFEAISLTNSFYEQLATFSFVSAQNTPVVSVGFGEVPNTNDVGICKVETNGTREVILSKRRWDTLSKAEKEITVFHELGHCALDKSHSSEGIMSAEMMDADTYTRNKAAFLTLFFN